MELLVENSVFGEAVKAKDPSFSCGNHSLKCVSTISWNSIQYLTGIVVSTLELILSPCYCGFDSVVLYVDSKSDNRKWGNAARLFASFSKNWGISSILKNPSSWPYYLNGLPFCQSCEIRWRWADSRGQIGYQYTEMRKSKRLSATPSFDPTRSDPKIWMLLRSLVVLSWSSTVV